VGFRRGYEFIACRNSGHSSSRIFFHFRGIRPDSIGRISDCWHVGAQVRFRLAMRNGQTTAADVHPIWREAPVVCVEAHREVSRVESLIPQKRMAFLIREEGSSTALHIKNVSPQYEHRFDELRLGDFVFHGVSERNDLWDAVNAELYSREENDALRRGEELLVEEPVQEIQSELLSPENKNRTLIEIIQEKKRGNQ
jgi:hypothetical protein